MIQESKIFRDAGGLVNGTLAISAMTSEAIPFTKNINWSLNIWFSATFSYSGKPPTVTIEVSNSTDDSSFKTLEEEENITVPEYWERLYSSWKYMRVVYTPNGASAGNKYFDLIQFV